jgi:DNA polymerase III subunit alpha
MNIKVMPPDINESFADFTVVYENAGDKKGQGLIRFGLAAVKGVGTKAVEQIIAAREKVGRFKSLFHFCENVDLRAVNKQVGEALIKAGAFDRLGGHRAQLTIALEKAMQVGQSAQADKLNGQMNFFSGITAAQDSDEDSKQLPNVPPWPELMMLSYEKDVLGFYVTSNPLSKHAEEIAVYSSANTSQLAAKEQQEIIIGGMVAKMRQIITKNGRNAGSKMAVFTLQDLQGSAEVVVFSEVLAQYGHLLDVDKILFARGKVDCRRELPNVIAEELIAIEEAGEKLAAKVRIKLRADDVNEQKVANIRTICSGHRGKSPVYVTVITDKGTHVSAVADKSLTVRPDVEFCKKMKQLVGEENFALSQ